jgi:hypothetical protein
MSGGLAKTDTGTTTSVIGGRTLAFFNAVAAHYGAPPPLWDFEPHVAEALFNDLLARSNVTLRLNARIVSLARGAGARLTAAALAGGGAVSARVWVDATYEGALLPLAGASFAYGREANTTFGESIAGVLPVPHPAWEPAHPFVGQPQVWAGVAGREADGSPLPQVAARAPGPVGSGDDLIQSYSYRVTFTKNQSNILRPWPRPAGYDRRLYQLQLNAIAARNLTTFESVVWYGAPLPCLPAGACTPKGDENQHALAQFYLATPYAPAVAAGDWAAQEAVWAAQRAAQLGLFYFLATDAAVPQSIRDSAGAFGLPLDEHAACGHFPCQLYVREALRLRGDFVLTQRDIFDGVAQPDSVGRGAYSVDVMHASLFLAPDGAGGEALWVEGGMQAPSFLNKTIAPFQVPYRALLPRAAEATNLLVPVALSASHVAFNAVRLEPTWMTVGESAGVAAAIACKRDVDVQRVDVAELQARLRALGQVL